MLNSEEIKPIALAVIELCLIVVSQSFSIEKSVESEIFTNSIAIYAKV